MLCFFEGTGRSSGERGRRPSHEKTNNCIVVATVSACTPVVKLCSSVRSKLHERFKLSHVIVAVVSRIRTTLRFIPPDTDL